MYITIQDVASFIIFCLIVACSTILIITLINLNKVIGRVRGILEKNNENINEILKDLPNAVKNINAVSRSAKESIDKAGTAIEALENTISETVTTVTESADNVITYAKIAGEIIRIVINTFSKCKE